MSKRTRISGLILGTIVLVWAIVGPFVVPSARLTPTECWVGGLAAVLVIVACCYPWTCMKCHGEGTGPDVAVTSELDLVLVTATCDWCGGDGKGRI